MVLASASEQSNDTNNSETNDTNNSQDNLSPEQENAQKELSKAEQDLADLEKEKEQLQNVYDKHNERHAEAQDLSDSESEGVELGFLERIKPELDRLEEELENAQEHVQTLTDLLKSLF